MTKIKDVPAALTLFEEAAFRHAEATEQGDHKIANKCYATISKVVTFLKERNEVLALSRFMDHPSVGVRMWAATYLLPVKEDEGIMALEQIAAQAGIHSFTAKTTLDEWRKGDLIV